MKKLVLGLILMSCTLSALPAQAHAPDDGVQKEVVYQDVATPIVSVDFTISVPQVQFENFNVFNVVDNWNLNFQNQYGEKPIFENESFRFRRANTILNFSPNLLFTSKFIHIDPGRRI